MVMSATSYSGSGLRDWLLQRFSAVILALFTLFLLSFVALHSPMTFAVWSSLFSHPLMQIATSVTLFAVVIHAWIGVWTVIGDYVNCWCLRLALHSVVLTGLLALIIWGMVIVWSAPV